MRIPLLNFEGGPGVALLNFRGVQGPRSQYPEVPGSGLTFTPCLKITIFALPLYF